MGMPLGAYGGMGIPIMPGMNGGMPMAIPIIAGGAGAPVANVVCGRMDLWGFCAASMRSAGVPCRSPLVSFFSAYETEMGLLHRNCPFMVSMAASLASNESKLMNP